MNKTTVCFDVDGTLITLHDKPNYKNIDLFKHFERMGCEMFIWSGSGVDWAENWAFKLGLEAKIVAKGSFKPDIAVDDMEVQLATINLKVD